MNADLTPKQRQILDFIARRLEEQGGPPTFREIAGRFGLSLGAAQDRVAALAAKGAIRREAGKARGILLAAKAPLSSGFSLPVLGQVPAGAPVEAVENMEERLSLDKSLAGKADFILRVKGESMEPEILDADMVLVRQAAFAESGEVVVARVGEDEATVKRLRRRGRSVFLEAANPKHPPIKREFRIIGKVVGLLRRYGK